MGALLLARVLVLLSISHSIVALVQITLHKLAHPQTILGTLRTNVLKLIAMLMMIRTAHLLALVHPTTLSLSVHKLRRGIMHSFLLKYIVIRS